MVNSVVLCVGKPAGADYPVPKVDGDFARNIADKRVKDLIFRPVPKMGLLPLIIAGKGKKPNPFDINRDGRMDRFEKNLMLAYLMAKAEHAKKFAPKKHPIVIGLPELDRILKPKKPPIFVNLPELVKITKPKNPILVGLPEFEKPIKPQKPFDLVA